MADLTDIYGALQQADASGDTESAQQLADYLRSAGDSSSQSIFDAKGNIVTPATVTSSEQQQGIGSWLKSNVGVPLARSAINAVTGLPLMAENLGVAVRNVGSDISQHGLTAAGSHLLNQVPFTGGKYGTPYQYPYELPGNTLQTALQPYLPAPTSTASRISEVINSGIMGAGASAAGVPGLTAPTYGNAPPAFVSPSARGGLTPGQQNAADAGQELGMRLTPGQQTGSTALQQFEAKLQSQPWTSGPFNRLSASNQAALNRAWAGPSGGIGEGGTSLDSTVLARAADRTGEIFNNARNASSIVAADPKTTSGILDAIDQEFEGLIPGSIRANPLVARFEALTGEGAINGEQLGNLSSKLGRAANNQMTSAGGDRELGQALYAVKDHADDLLQSTMTGKEAAAYAAARQQYRALMQVTARPGNLNPNTGNVGGTSVADYLQTKDKGGFLFGRNQTDAYNAARFAQAFKPIIGNSGTATRSWSLSELPLAVPANIFSRAYLTRPGQAVTRGLMSIPGVVDSGLPPAQLSGLLTGIANTPQSGFLWGQ